MTLVVRDAAASLAELARAVDADRGAHLYVDRSDGVLECVASIRDGVVTTGPGAPAAAAAVDGGLLRRWLTSGPGRSGSVARLSLPGEPVGMLVLERRRSEPFSESDLALARVKARQMVGRAITRLAQRPIAWSAQLEAVQSVAAQLTRLTSVEEVSATLCTQTQRVVAFDNARVYVIGDDGVTLEPVAFRPQAPEYQGESVAGLRVRVGEGITGWVAASGQTLIVHDAANDPRAVDVPGSLDLAEESMLLAPLRSEGRVTGVVVLSRLGLNRFVEDELRLLGVLADQAAVAIENARLLAARERHVAELAALLDISQASGQAADEAELAGLLARKLATTARFDACVISQSEEGSGALRRLGEYGFDDRGVDALRPGSETPTHRAARQVLMGDEPRILDPERDELEPAELSRLEALGASSLLLLPLSMGGRVQGLVEFVSRVQGRVVREVEMSLLRTMANQAAAALENARLVRQLRDAAETDLVTGVYSHRHLQDRMRQECARAARTRSPLSVLMVDLDDFKRVNDRYGHQAGDRVLRAIAGCLRASVRASDVVARYGGDEFVVLMPDTGEPQSRQVAQRAGAAVAALAHPMADGAEVHVSCSVGLALHPRDGRSGKTLLRAADAAMYARKRARARPGTALAVAPSGGPESAAEGRVPVETSGGS